MALCPLLEHGKARVAAGAENDVRSELVDDLIGAAQRAANGDRRADIVPDGGGRQLAQIACDRQRVQTEARARDEICLHPVHRADKEDLRFRALGAQQLRHRQSRIDVSSRAAAGKYDPQNKAPLIRTL